VILLPGVELLKLNDRRRRLCGSFRFLAVGASAISGKPAGMKE